MIVLLEPPRPPGFVSGGYRFHDRVGTWLESVGIGRRHAVGGGQLQEEIARLRAADREAVPAVDGRFVIDTPDGTLPPEDVVLLVHGLHSEAPDLTPAQRAVLAAREDAWFAAARRVVVTGGALAQRLRARSRDVAVVTPGLDACFRPGPLPADDGRIHVTAVGTVWPGKGQLELVAAIAQDRALARTVTLHLLGDCTQDLAYVGSIRSAAAAAELAVELTGCMPAEAVAERLRASRLFVSASRVESYGMAVAEAIACGVPVLAFAAGEIARFGAGVEGVQLLPVDASAAAFAEALRALLRTLPQLRSGGRPRRFPTWAEAAQAFSAACRA